MTITQSTISGSTAATGGGLVNAAAVVGYEDTEPVGGCAVTGKPVVVISSAVVFNPRGAAAAP